ncbi:MAG: hypothetical protein CMP11_02590 [Zetaproteobacteria bacterium]|nr:hypothetical protein [Pseudobdellovibrionaceae bacterium]|tara:strand:- start:924 stop:1895 length:972 start_codon:yes stop_codon:yes gene_type:complete
MQINKNKLYLYLSLILFRGLLELSYTLFVVKEYQYAGFFLNFSIEQYILSWFLYFISFVFAKASIKKVSDFFLIMNICAIIAPITILYGYNFDYPFLPVLSTILFFLIIYLILKIKIPIKSQFYQIKQGKKIVVFLSSFFVILLISRAAISNVQINFDFKKVYDLRAINRKILSSGVFAYLTTWTYKIFNPILIILSLLRKKYFLSSLFIIIQIYFFAITTHKTVLVFPLIPFFLYFFLSKTKKVYSLIMLSNVAFCCTLFSYFVLDDVWLSSLFSRRAFFVPAQLTFAYFDFFSKHPKVYWSNSVLKYFLEYSYNISLTCFI